MSDALRFPRRRRGFAGTLTAFLLLVVSAAAGYLAVMKALGRAVTVVDLRPAIDAVAATSWSDPSVLYIGIAVTVLGVIALSAAFTPARRSVIELVPPDDVTAAGISTTGLRRTLESGATAVDGIRSASAVIGKRVVRLDVTSALRHTDGLADAANSVATRDLGALQLRRPLTVTTRLHRKDR